MSYIGYGGTGKQVRDMVHIKDLFNIIDKQIHQNEKFNGQIFNIGGGRKISTSLQELTNACELISGNKIQIQSIPETRKADVRLYISDNTKINAITEWTPEITVGEILEDIFLWIKNNEHQLKPILS